MFSSWNGKVEKRSGKMQETDWSGEGNMGMGKKSQTAPKCRRGRAQSVTVQHDKGRGVNSRNAMPKKGLCERRRHPRSGAGMKKSLRTGES